MKIKVLKTRMAVWRGAAGSPLNFSLAAKKIKSAFTVAEVLVTLAVIGIIASFVVSRIKLKMQEITTVAKVKNVYSLISASFDASVKKYGTPDKWGLQRTKLDDDENAILDSETIRFYSILLEGIKAENVVLENLQQETNYLNSKEESRYLQAYYLLPGGTTFSGGWIEHATCATRNNPNNMYLKNICSDIRIDINGFDKPNIQGVDQFQFFITKRGVVPIGLKDDLFRPIEKYCAPKGESPRPKLNGYACTAWVIEKGTMPWLYGKQVKWD